MWRPEGWLHGGGYQDEVNGAYLDNEYTRMFEAGADDMLTYLLQCGEHQTCTDQFDKERPFTTGIGWLIFIPEEV